MYVYVSNNYILFFILFLIFYKFIFHVYQCEKNRIYEKNKIKKNRFEKKL